jgi:hypothetical protein
MLTEHQLADRLPHVAVAVCAAAIDGSDREINEALDLNCSIREQARRPRRLRERQKRKGNTNGSTAATARGK